MTKRIVALPSNDTKDEPKEEVIKPVAKPVVAENKNAAIRLWIDEHVAASKAKEVKALFANITLVGDQEEKIVKLLNGEYNA